MTDPTPSWADHVQAEHDDAPLQHGAEVGQNAVAMAAAATPPAPDPASPQSPQTDAVSDTDLGSIGGDLMLGGAVGGVVGAGLVEGAAAGSMGRVVRVDD